jgi:DNA-binding response OmpR family regulator
MKTFNILLIEDDKELAELTKEYLELFEFSVVSVESGTEAISASSSKSFDLIICDVNLPDIQGFELIGKLTLEPLTPVLFLTALSDTNSHITGLNSGACDYIIKPVEPEILLAKVRAHLRLINPTAAGEVIEIADLALDNIHKTFHFKQQQIKLTAQEFEMLWFFVSKGDTVITREQIFSEVIGREYDGADRAADLRVSRFRKKMESLNLQELEIESIRNQGYVFNYWATIR